MPQRARAAHSAGPSLLAGAAAAVVAVVLVLLAGGVHHAHAGAAAAQTAAAVPVHVGVILDLGTGLGKKSLLSLKMALEDFYAAHPAAATRVSLHVKDSERDVVSAAAAVASDVPVDSEAPKGLREFHDLARLSPSEVLCRAVDLIRNDKVSVIIGPQSTLQAEFVTYLANKTKVPVISFSATGDAATQYNVPYFLRACPKDSFQAASIAAFVEVYGWKNIAVVYEDDNYGVGILPSIANALQGVEAHIVYRAAIPASCPDSRIDEELYKLMTMQTRVFIVHMLPGPASHFFARASAAGMMIEGYVWIVTDNVGVVLDVLPQHTIENMQGIVSFRPYVAKSARIIDFVSRFDALFRAKYREAHDVRITRPTVYQYWAYDVAWAVATAVEDTKRVGFSNIGFQTPQDMCKANLVNGLLASHAGPELLSSILEADFDGLAGRFKFVDGHMQVPIYEVVNLVGEKARGLGFWSPGSGLSRLLESSPVRDQVKSSSSSEVLKPVIWPGDSTTVPKGWDFPVNAKILRIGVPVRREFKFFVNVEANHNTNRSSVSGYSIDVFEAAVNRLPYALRYEYIPYDCANSYDQLISQVYFKKFDAAVGDVTIIANRTRYVDFTMPYTESGVAMLVLAKTDDKAGMWIFLEPLTKELWIATMVFIFFTGLVVWMIEHPENDEFKGSRWKQFSTAFYFTFSTLTFSHDQIINKLHSKVVVVIWCFVVLVLVQSYTASLSSLLTAKRLQPSVTDPMQLLRNGDYVGYQNGSFVHTMLKRLQFDAQKIKVLSTLEEYAKALRTGSKHGGVSAIFDEIPYLNSFLTQYGKEFQIVDPIHRTDGFGFVFPRGSPLVPDLSRAILNITEGCEGFQIQKKWFRDTAPSHDYDNPDTDSVRLGLESFKGLFIVNGLALCVMLVISLPEFMHTNWIELGNHCLQWVHSSREIATDNDPQQGQQLQNNSAVLSERLQIERRTN